MWSVLLNGITTSLRSISSFLADENEGRSSAGTAVWYCVCVSVFCPTGFKTAFTVQRSTIKKALPNVVNCHFYHHLDDYFFVLGRIVLESSKNYAFYVFSFTLFSRRNYGVL